MTAAWQLEASAARLAARRLTGFVDLSRPERGWQRPALDVSPQSSPSLDAELLCIDLPPAASAALAEGYVRGGDLIATYEQTAGHPARTQVYWRDLPSQRGAAPAEIVGGLELVVSVQTSLLDSDPALTISSRLPARGVWQSAPSGEFVPVELAPADGAIPVASRAALFEGSAGLWYLEMVHPTDAEGGDLTRDAAGQYQLRRPLFARRLEKGVILRARVRGLFLRGSPGPALFAVAQSAQAAFAASEPPLTT